MRSAAGARCLGAQVLTLGGKVGSGGRGEEGEQSVHQDSMGQRQCFSAYADGTCRTQEWLGLELMGALKWWPPLRITDLLPAEGAACE